MWKQRNPKHKNVAGTNRANKNEQAEETTELFIDRD